MIVVSFISQGDSEYKSSILILDKPLKKAKEVPSLYEKYFISEEEEVFFS